MKFGTSDATALSDFFRTYNVGAVGHKDNPEVTRNCTCLDKFLSIMRTHLPI